MTKPRYAHSVNFSQAEEDRLQDILKKRNINFGFLVGWAIDKAEENLKKEGK